MNIIWKKVRDDLCTTVWIDVAKLDASWRNDHDFYLPRGQITGDADGRYKRFGQWLKAGQPVEPPEICINRHLGCVSFDNGRHRFAWLRDHGVTTLPVSVPKDQATEIRKSFGTKERLSILIQ